MDYNIRNQWIGVDVSGKELATNRFSADTGDFFSVYWQSLANGF
jgi:hypothetical protein